MTTHSEDLLDSDQSKCKIHKGNPLLKIENMYVLSACYTNYPKTWRLVLGKDNFYRKYKCTDRVAFFI